MRKSSLHVLVCMTAMTILGLEIPSWAGDAGPFELGVRGNIATVSGEPTNDMTGGGIVGRYRISDQWLIGFGVDQWMGFDVEGPAEMIGIRQDPAVKTIDAKGDALMVSTWVERRFGEKPQGGLSWFCTAGLGLNFVDVDDVTGGTESGARFDIETDPGTEFILSASAGPRYTFANDWAVELGIKADYHFADWEVRDRISGRKDTVDDYTALGGYLGISYRF